MKFSSIITNCPILPPQPHPFLSLKSPPALHLVYHHPCITIHLFHSNILTSCSSLILMTLSLSAKIHLPLEFWHFNISAIPSSRTFLKQLFDLFLSICHISFCRCSLIIFWGYLIRISILLCLLTTSPQVTTLMIIDI